MADSPYIIRLSSRNGVRGPLHNPTFVFASPFRVPQDHHAVMKLSKMFFVTPNITTPKGAQLFLSIKRGNQYEEKTVNMSEYWNNQTVSFDLDNTFNLANVFQFYQVLGEQINLSTEGNLELYLSQTNRTDSTYRDRTFRLGAGGTIGAFRDAFIGSNGTLRWGFYSSDTAIEEVIMFGPALRALGRTDSDSVLVPVYHNTSFTQSQVDTFAQLSVTPSIRYVRVMCDKVANAYSNLMDRGDVVNPDATLALVPLKGDVDNFVYYEESSGNNHVLLNGEYIDSIRFYFQDGVTGEQLFGMSVYEIELELKIININQPSTAGIMEDVRRILMEK